MGITIGSNISAFAAQRQLTEATKKVGADSDRLASGLRINRASDDAAGLAISSQLNADARVFNQAVRNVNDGISALSIAEGALRELSNIMIRQRELAEQAANGVYSYAQRKALDRESDALVDEFNRIISVTSFNGRNLLDNSFQNVQVQAGYGANGGIQVGIGSELARFIGDGTFTAASSSSLITPLDVVAADVNNDGNLDYIASDNVATGRVFVSLGNGNGTFRAATSYVSGRNTGLRAADFDGDGFLDLVGGGGGGPDSVNVLLNTGNGTFSPGTLIYQMPSIVAVDTGDLNGDGKMDFISTGTSSAISLGNGNGTFLAPVSIPNFGSTTGISIGDVNNDGKPDFITTRHGVYVFLGNGDGSFSQAVTYATPGGGIDYTAKFADLNGDDYLDIVTVTVTGVVFTLLGNGDGSFNVAASYAVGTTFHSVATGDFNGDEKTDMLVGENAGTGVYLLFGNGDATFKAPGSYATGGAVGNLAVGDFNNDDVADYVTVEGGTPSARVSLGGAVATTQIAHFNLRTQAGAREALTTSAEVLDRISKELGSIGAKQVRLQVAASNLQTASENYIASASRILDADVAEEAAKFVADKIRQQVASAVLAQANQLPALALKLLG